MSPNHPTSTLDLIHQLWAQASLPPSILRNTINAGHIILPHEPSLHGQAIRSSFQLTAVAQAAASVVALTHSLYIRLLQLSSDEVTEEIVEGVVLDRVEVDARHAIAEYFGWTRLAPHSSSAVGTQENLANSIPTDSSEGRKVLGISPDAVADWDDLAGLYETKPGGRGIKGVVRIHTNFPHHKLGILQLLGLLPPEIRWNDEGIQRVFERVRKEDIQRRVKNWDAFEFEAAAQGRGLCVTAYRSRDEWMGSAMGKVLRNWMEENVDSSAFRISRIASGDCLEQKREKGRGRGRGRLKVIDMSRVIAGPVATRSLAALGADVLLISSPHLPNLPLREVDTARGKRTTFLHLATSSSELPPELISLIEQADVFSQAYRPASLASKGLTPEKLQQLRPGIIYAELCAFGFTGPWSDRRAYDSLTQTAVGMNYFESTHYSDYLGKKEEEERVEPKPLPVQALDYVAGSLMCFATLSAKCRAMLEGDEGVGWKVQVSLASVAEWIISLGQLEGMEAWEEPPERALPEDGAGWVEVYKVRGSKKGEEGRVEVLAIRPASIAARAAVEQRQQEEQEGKGGGGLQWTVPAHLNVDALKWID
ncbi:hypothetical protein NDA14_000139 [Ustilago hordei]|nr:hypothetical protein NDA14_000139 [Ustilago hordei]